MITVIFIIFSISLLLYVLLGGADFGAGIIEMCTGKKNTDTISKTIAPVWEANHIWLILAVVILFNAFPLVYTHLLIYLHIPVLFILIGITFRGAAFTFRYYDIIQDKTYQYYTVFFRISSLVTPFFMGMIVGAIMLGRMPDSPNGKFYQLYIDPWINPFTINTGIFMIVLFAWLAAIFLMGEVKDEATYKVFKKTAAIFNILLILSGISVFILGEHYDLHLLSKFIKSYWCLSCAILATLLTPTLWNNLKRRNIFWPRFITGLQTTCILTGWVALQFPVMISITGGDNLTIWNSHAPGQTLHLMLIALLVGIAVIFPALTYLLYIFKSGKIDQPETESDELPYI